MRSVLSLCSYNKCGGVKSRAAPFFLCCCANQLKDRCFTVKECVYIDGPFLHRQLS